MTEPLLATEAQTETTEGQTDETPTTSSEQVEGKTTEQQDTSDETTTTEKTEEPQGAPETYEFKNPEGYPEEVDESIREAYSEVARELDLPQDKAQAVYEKTMSAIYKRAIEAQDQQAAAWIKAAKEDPEYGGSKLTESIGVAKRALEEFGSDGLREMLSVPGGLGDHPEMIRFLFRVGQAVREDRFVDGSQTPAEDREATRARRMYPSAAS